MVEETNDSSCLNYKQIRHQFEEYDLSDLFETPKKNTTPKVNLDCPFTYFHTFLYFRSIAARPVGKCLARLLT